MELYKTNNPVPSADMRDIFDDNRVQDRLLNGEELEVESRTGEKLPSWKGIIKKNDDLINNTRQNLIPLSRQYMTLATAQADIANIPDGATTYVRSIDNTALAFEYINNGGALVATGRSMPSRLYIDKINSQLRESVLALSSTMAVSTSVTSTGDTAVGVAQNSLIIAESAGIALGGDSGEIYATRPDGDIFRHRLYPDESMAAGLLRSPYRPLNLSGSASEIALRLIGDTVTRLAVSADLTPDASFDGTRTVFSLDEQFTATTQGGQGSAVIATCVGHTSGAIYLGIPNSAIVAAGYALTLDGVLAYYQDKYKSISLYYRTTHYSKSTVLLFGNVTDDITVHIDPSVNAVINILNSKSGADITPSTQLSTYNADIYNPAGYGFESHPLSIKIQFSPGEVSEHSAMRLVDSAGTAYPCQFAGVLDANLRKNADLERYTDGSFNTGEVFFYGDIAAGEKKQFRLEVYGNSGFNSAKSGYPKLNYDAGANRYSITVGDFTWKFSSLTGSTWSVTRADSEMRIQTIKRISGITAGAAVENTNYLSFSLRLVNSGPVFAEVEQIAYHAEQGSVPAGSVMSVTRYRLFSTGVMQVFNLFQATQEIPANSLYGVRLDIGLEFGANASASVYNSASIVRNVALTGTDWSLVNEFSIGDALRDDASKLNRWGAIRPNLGVMVRSGEEIRMRSGWTFSSLTDNNLINYVVPKNWTWSAGHWIFPYSIGSTERELSNRVFNRPVGLAYKGVPSYVMKRSVYELMERLADGIFDMYTNAENGQISASDKSGYRYPQAYGLLQCLREGGDFDAQYAIFKTFITDIIGSYTNAGTAYLNGSIVLQFVGRMMFAPVEMYYRYAEKTGNTAVMNDLKVFIASICDGLATRVEASNGTPLDGSQNYRGNGNSNAEGMRMLAIGIYAGLDSAGRYRAAFDKITAMIKSNTYASFAHPVVMDTFSAYPFMNRWLSYECHFYYVYLRACKL
ncbi:hypothetical protein RI820_004889, partial [Pluralibacter gergoviae]|nr:hypothetical protein [Pluralibacter gergoviae]ELC3019890.1 hypothetical protein [Pluralibacter gergoviae]ELC3024887.1 hypothetical protein [Pluralibacter gergoviae]